MKLKKFDIKLYLIFFLLFLVAVKLNAFKKIYLILTEKETYNFRLANTYDFCSSTGIGYVNYIKTKYKLENIPEIISFHRYPELYWIFNDTNFNSKNYKIILFNLDKKNEFRFDTKNYLILNNFKNDCLFLKKK